MTTDVISSPKIIDHPIKESAAATPVSYIFIALAVIALIGSAVATGVLYSQLGNTALAIAGGGIAFAILCIAISRCCMTPKPTVVSLTASTNPTPIKKTNYVNAETERKIRESITTTTPKEEPPKVEPPPPLPHIFDLKFDDTHPLAQALPKKPFEGFEGEPDHDLLNVTLNQWFDPEPYLHITVLMDEGRTEAIALIKTRLEELDKAIQFKERFKHLFPNLTIRDLLPAWNESPLRYKLIMDDELLLLKVSSIAQLDSEKVWDALDERRYVIENEKPFVPPSPFTKESIGSILLSDLSKLTAEQIHVSPQDFPPFTFLLIERSELRKIKTQRLSTEQLEFIFSATYYDFMDKEYYVQLLKTEQISACLHLIQNKSLLDNLSQAQTDILRGIIL